MPTRPLLGESSFQTLSIPHLCYIRTSGHWRGNKLWVADEDAIVSKQGGNSLSREPQSCCYCSTVHGPTPILYTVTFWLPCSLKYPITRFTAENCCSLLFESSTTCAGSVLTISCIYLFLSLVPNMKTNMKLLVSIQPWGLLISLALCIKKYIYLAQHTFKESIVSEQHVVELSP